MPYGNVRMRIGSLSSASVALSHSSDDTTSGVAITAPCGLAGRWVSGAGGTAARRSVAERGAGDQEPTYDESDTDRLVVEPRPRAPG